MPRDGLGTLKTKKGATGIGMETRAIQSVSTLYSASSIWRSVSTSTKAPFIPYCVCVSSCCPLGTTGSGISRGAKTIKAIEPMPTPVYESPHGMPGVSKEVEIITSCSGKFHLSNRKFFLIWKENLAPWLSTSCFPVCI